MKKSFKIVKFENNLREGSENILVMELLINNTCNLKCSYCYMRNEDDSWGQVSTMDNIKKILIMLKKVHNIFPIEISISGGEALLHKNIFEIFEILDSFYFNQNLHINTNLSKESFDTFMKLYKKYKKRFNFFLHLSFHPTEEILTNYIERLKILNTTNAHYELSYLFDPSIKIQEHERNIEVLHQNNKYIFISNFIYINSKFKKYKSLNVSKKYQKMFSKIHNVTFLNKNNKNINLNLNDFQLLNLNLIPGKFKGYNCFYKFFTINAMTMKIKEMCSLFKLDNFYDSYNFFIQYAKKLKNNKTISCPFEDCLWPSALYMKKSLK